VAHIRQQVREKVRERLATIAGLTVPENVAGSVVDASLPAALVSTPSEEVTAPARNQDDGGGLALRRITVVVVLVDHGDVSEDDLDARCVDVEKKLADDLDGLVRFFPPVANMRYELERMTDEGGERWYSFVELTFTFETATQLGDPEVVL